MKYFTNVSSKHYIIGLAEDLTTRRGKKAEIPEKVLVTERTFFENYFEYHSGFYLLSKACLTNHITTQILMSTRNEKEKTTVTNPLTEKQTRYQKPLNYWSKYDQMFSTASVGKCEMKKKEITTT